MIMNSNLSTLSKLTLGIIVANISLVNAAPTNGTVTNGSATISNDGLYIDQGSNSADVVTIQWDSFDINVGETVVFNQHVNDVAINNITDQNPSSILGSIQGNGTVFLSNSNGFIFGSNSTVNTGSFLATTSTIADAGNNTFTLTDSASDGYISISSDADFSSSSEGFIAFVSNHITTSQAHIESDTSITDENERQDLISAIQGTSQGSIGNDNQTILLSNNDAGTIQLAGLGINFTVDTTDLHGSSNTDTLNISDLNISGNTVILSGNQLASLTNSAINSPASITAENLIIDSQSDIGNITDAIENAFTQRDNNDGITFNELSIQYRNSDFSLNNTLNINSSGTLSLISNQDISLIDQNIYGSSLNLKVQADIIDIGNSVTEFGGTNGLNSVLLSATNRVNLFGSLVSVSNTEINGSLYIDNSLSSAYIYSQSGSIVANNAIYGIDSQDFELRSNVLSVNEISGFNKIRLNAGQIHLHANINSNTIEFSNTSSLRLFENVTLTGQEIDIDGATLSSNDGNDGLTIIGTTSNNDISLQNITENTSLNTLQYLHVYGSESDSVNNVYISGKLDIDNFCIHSCTGNSSNTTYDISLEEATQFTSISSFITNHASITGDYLLTVKGADSASSYSEIGVIDNLNGLNIADMSSIELAGNVDTKEGGLSLIAEIIQLNPSDDTIIIKNDDSGSINIQGSTEIQGNGKGFTIATKNSDIHLHNLTNMGEINISNELSGEGSLNLYGDINSNSNITLSNFDNLNVLDSIVLTAGSSASFNSLNSTIFANNNDLTIYANTINSGEINAQNISLYASNTNLSGDLISTGQVNFFQLDTGGLVSSHNEIRLMNDVTINGELDLLKQLFNQSSESYVPSISGEDFDLNLTASNSDIYLSNFGSDESINALSISGNGTIHLNSLPNLSGIEGLSLLGNLIFDVGSGQHIFDTSSYNGNLDFSGVDIIGSGTLKFSTGTGELSLGNIGINISSPDQVFTDLTITSTGRLNLHGEIVTNDTNYDFSKLNSIQLEHDITLGTADAPAVINFGQATINGTYSLTLYSNEITLGRAGNNVALQDLTIVSTEGTVILNNDINMVGNANITANTLELNSAITTTGLNVNISTTGDLTMAKEAQINADFGDVNLSSTEGNIGLGFVSSGNTVNIRSEAGFIFNAIDDYISNESTSINIQSTNQDLYGLLNVGESVDSPIVVDVLNGGAIKAESSGTVFIANLANANIESSSRVIDSASGGDTASLDALTLLKLSSLNNTNMPTVTSNLGLISNLVWQVDEDESIRKIKTPPSTPSIYYSRKGWKLGY